MVLRTDGCLNKTFLDTFIKFNGTKLHGNVID
jgi:hypothetical protein